MATAMMLIFVLFNVINTFITGAIGVKSFTNHYSISDNKLIQCGLSQLLAVIKILIQKILLYDIPVWHLQHLYSGTFECMKDIL